MQSSRQNTNVKSTVYNLRAACMLTKTQSWEMPAMVMFCIVCPNPPGKLCLHMQFGKEHGSLYVWGSVSFKIKVLCFNLKNITKAIIQSRPDTT